MVFEDLERIADLVRESVDQGPWEHQLENFLGPKAKLIGFSKHLNPLTAYALWQHLSLSDAHIVNLEFDQSFN